MKTSMRRRRRTEGGAAAVEFALVVPLLVFLLFAIISYGYMLSFRQALSQAAAEGARAAAVSPEGLPYTAPGTSDSIKSRATRAINQGLGSYGVTCTDSGVLRRDDEDAGTCTVGNRTTCTGTQSVVQCVEVELSYTYEDDSLLPVFPGLGVLLPERLTYSTQAEVS